MIQNHGVLRLRRGQAPGAQARLPFKIPKCGRVHVTGEILLVIMIFEVFACRCTGLEDSYCIEKCAGHCRVPYAAFFPDRLENRL